MTHSALLAAVGVAAMAGSAHGAIFFTFDDPGSPHEVSYDRSGGSGGDISYSSAAPVDLGVTSDDPGIPDVVFSTVLSMDIVVGGATPVDLNGDGSNDGFRAPISGSFVFSSFANPAQSLLTGTFKDGALITFDTAGAMVASSLNSSLAYTASNGLFDLINGAGYPGLAPQFDASFSLSDITPAPTVDGEGNLMDFTASASFVGRAELIPAPGALAFAAIGAGAFTARRRRR